MSSFHNCENVVEIEHEPYHHLVIANNYIRAFAVDIPPRAHTLCHHHTNEYLLYIAQGAEIISTERDEEPKRLNYADGESALSQAGLVHVVENLSDHSFRNVVVELLPGATELWRGDGPAVISGEARVERVLSEEPGAIFVVEIEPGTEVEIAGPAVLAAPYGPVMVKELEEFDIRLDDFRKMMWVCKPRKIWVSNGSLGAVKAVVTQVGAKV